MGVLSSVLVRYDRDLPAYKDTNITAHAYANLPAEGTGTGTRVPAELVQEILEWVVFPDPKELGTLLLVARMIKEWLEPLRFRVVRLDKSRRAHFFMETIRTKEHIARGVHHIFLPSLDDDNGTFWPIDDVLDALGRCPNIRGIALSFAFNGPVMLPSLATIAPRRLAATLFELFEKPNQIDPSHPALAHVTHLWLFDGYERDEDDSPSVSLAIILGHVCKAATSLPSLTHLELSIFDCTVLAEIQPQLQELVGGALHLQCLLLRIPESIEVFGMDVADVATTFQFTDARIVLLRNTLYADSYAEFWEHWEESALGFDDLWTLADDFIAAKRNNFAPADEFWMENWWEGASQDGHGQVVL
uniref:F-box domain-containing protein n=1 Tax=Mycena chlorophos TaxID=658473 RepID=A0ABQ0KUJ1_MYCCL|nr:predicted protein [Mycena chlorophos]